MGYYSGTFELQRGDKMVLEFFDGKKKAFYGVADVEVSVYTPEPRPQDWAVPVTLPERPAEMDLEIRQLCEYGEVHYTFYVGQVRTYTITKKEGT